MLLLVYIHEDPDQLKITKERKKKNRKEKENHNNKLNILSYFNVGFFLQSLETLDNGKPYNISFNVDLALTIKCYR